MIAPDMLAAAADIARSFQTAKPFKHVCLDNFLAHPAAEQALADFPPFERKNAINEFGEVGRKAVNTKLRDISPFYASFYDWLFSEDFLTGMSRLTGIPDLIGDPSMYGGGTHENLHGQQLDPHVDFNYVSGGNAHRRVNLLIYLNKNWDPAWGGALEIHSNPRDPDNNRIIPYDLTFNRAIIFETNEYSWHGFPKIELPEYERETNSRKCLSIYLYTRTRPPEEIAGTHGTFYVQRPLPAHIRAGAYLTQEDETELRKGYRNRDNSIEAYQKLEERLGRERDGLNRYLDEINASLKLPVIGFAMQLRRISGQFWHDSWVGPEAKFEFRAVEDISRVEVHGLVPYVGERGAVTISIAVGEAATGSVIVREVNFGFACPVVIKSGTVFSLSLACNGALNPAKTGTGDDNRDLAFVVSMIKFV